jgi:hypothetical protein
MTPRTGVMLGCVQPKGQWGGRDAWVGAKVRDGSSLFWL